MHIVLLNRVSLVGIFGKEGVVIVYGDGQGGLACCSPWGHKELDMTEQLN